MDFIAPGGTSGYIHIFSLQVSSCATKGKTSTPAPFSTTQMHCKQDSGRLGANLLDPTVTLGRAGRGCHALTTRKKLGCQGARGSVPGSTMVTAAAHAALSLGPGQGLGPGSHGAEAAPAGGHAPPSLHPKSSAVGWGSAGSSRPGGSTVLGFTRRNPCGRRDGVHVRRLVLAQQAGRWAGNLISSGKETQVESAQVPVSI